MGVEQNRRIYWHRELPPLDAKVMGEQIVEATSGRVPGTLAHRDELWDQCYKDLMGNAYARIRQEIDRLGATSAHVLSETVDSRHDAGTGEAWLHGSFTCAVYRQPDGFDEQRSPAPEKSDYR